MKLRRRETVSLQLVTALGAAALLFPFLWMISASLQTLQEVEAFPPIWIPEVPQWTNYVEAVVNYNIGRALLNSAIVTTVSVVGQLIVCSLGAYAFSRLRFPGRDAIFLLVLATMMLPYPSIIVPLFILFKELGWINTILPLVVPTFFATSAFYIFLLRQFFMTLPLELDDAARVDGCSTFGIFYRICVPLIKPALGIILVFSFMHHWNDFLGPLIFLGDLDQYTLALGLRFFQGQHRVEWTLLMAASLIILSPCIILFFIAQKNYIQGIVITGVKG